MSRRPNRWPTRWPVLTSVLTRVTAATVLAVAITAGCTSENRSAATPMSSVLPTTSLTTAPSSKHPADAPIPPVSAAARAVGLVDVRSVIPDAIVDLRYATRNNFVGAVLYPAGARCLIHQSMAPGLQAAGRAARAAGEVVVFWDCYRPHSVQRRMFTEVPNPAWVARPDGYSRSHEAGRSVDVTLARRGICSAPRRVADHCLLEMGTDFDDFTAAATAYATAGVSSTAQRNRAHLRAVMAAGGLTVYSGEWWHFDGPSADIRRPIIDVAPR